MLKDSLAHGQMLLRKTVLSLKERGVRQTVGKMLQKIRPGSAWAVSWTYAQWVTCFGSIGATDIQQMKDKLPSFEWMPKISVLFPMYDNDPVRACKTLQSVLDQVYPNVEICVSSSLTDRRKIEEKLKSEGYDSSGIHWGSEGDNRKDAFDKALAEASGDFVVVVKDTNILPPESIWVICHHINVCNGNVDALYGDEDRMDNKGNRKDPIFKSDWDGALYCADKLIGECVVWRTKCLTETSGKQYSKDNWEDSVFQNVLDRTENNRIIHIPHIICHCQAMKKPALKYHRGTQENQGHVFSGGRLPLNAFTHYGKPWRGWIEFVCPFHRGDVLLGLQVACTAAQKGIPVRMHVSKDLIHWLDDFAYGDDITLETIDIGIPKAEVTESYFAEAVRKVASREDFSGYLACSHPSKSLDELGIDLTENMLAQFGLPPDTQLRTVIVKDISEDRKNEIAAKLPAPMTQTVLLHPNGGWSLKSMSPETIKKTVGIVHALGFHVLQIGGPSDAPAEDADGYLLENLSLKDWAYLFRNSCALIGVDSWTAHFASIVHANQCIVYGSTAHKDVGSKPHFVDQTGKCLIMPSACEYVPCNSVSCRHGCRYCKGMTICADVIGSLLLQENK